MRFLMLILGIALLSAFSDPRSAISGYGRTIATSEETEAAPTPEMENSFR